MKFVLSKHAKQRLIERKIGIEDVQNTVELPDYIINREDKIEAYKKIKDKTLKVIYSKEDSFIKIITLIWT